MTFCVFCGIEVDPSRSYREVRGFEKPRQAGGANQITLREVIPDRFACHACIKVRQLGIDPAQGRLV